MVLLMKREMSEPVKPTAAANTVKEPMFWLAPAILPKLILNTAGHDVQYDAEHNDKIAKLVSRKSQFFFNIFIFVTRGL